MALSKPFIESCWDNDLEEVREYLNRVVNVDTFVLFTGLAIAARQNYLELLELLLSQPSIDVDPGITTGGAVNWTPLMLACREGHNKVVRRLLQVPGINIGYKDGYGCTALHYASQRGATVCSLLLIQRGKTPKLLHFDFSIFSAFRGSN